MTRSVDGLWRNSEGAVAPLIAISLFALIAAGGLAFDYSRMASLDTELQDGADQAALAGASQLDQTSGSMQRASAAAQSMLVNRTVMANDSNASGTAVTVPAATIMFYKTKSDAENDTNGFTDTTKFVDAHFIRVVVAARRANFAFTPVVGALTSGDVAAEAVAGLGQSICKVPPVMICNPQETSTNTGFSLTGMIGRGLKLVSVGNGSGSWAPGNFGYLENGAGVNGAPGLREALGWGTPPGDCLAQTGVNTQPGATVTVTDAINTRFDIYDSNQSCPTGGSCPASIDSVKDVKRPANASGNNACALHNQGWQLDTSGNSYYGANYPQSNAALATSVTPSAMGHPRDICHAVDSSVAGACTTPIGDGVWDRDAYFRTNYVRTVAADGFAAGTAWTGGSATTVGSWQYYTGLPATAKRYDVYLWEIAHYGTLVGGVTVLDPNPAGASGNTLVSYGLPQCSAAQGYGNGQIPGGTTTDRRKFSVAVVNCLQNSVNGSSTNVPVKTWLDVFLVEPSMNRARTNAGDVYVEIVGEVQAGGGSTAGQVIRRDVPYLVK